MLFSSISFWDDALAITIKTTRESVPSNIYYKMWTLVCRFFEGHSIFSCISIIMSSNIFSPKYLLKATIFFFASRLLVWFALVAPCCDPYQRKTIIFQNRNNFMVRMILGIFGHPNSSSAQKIAWCQNSTFAQMHFKKLKEELQATHSHSDRLAFSGKKIWHLMAANEGPFVLFLLA